MQKGKIVVYYVKMSNVDVLMYRYFLCWIIVKCKNMLMLKELYELGKLYNVHVYIFSGNYF